MTEVVPEGQVGDALVEHFTFTEEESAFTRMRAAWGRPHEFCAPGTYARLRVNGHIWMTDTTMERDSNLEALLNARGRVLVGGLGLGMVAAGLLRHPKVTTITVIENNPNVIALVEPALVRWAATLGKIWSLEVVEADLYTWEPPRGARYDTIYFDVWDNICRDNLPEIRTLKARYRRRLARGGWMGAWMEDE